MSSAWNNLTDAWTRQTQTWQANALELQHQAQVLQAKFMGVGMDGGMAGMGGGTFASRPDQFKTRPSEAGLHSVRQMENQKRRAPGLNELLRVDMDKVGDKIKDKLKWQTSLKWMVYELANREKVSEGCRQEFLKECYQLIKRELMHKDVNKRHRAVEKARYLWMIGYDMSKVCSLMVIEQMSLKGWHKWNGYQAAVCMFADDDDGLISTVANLIKADLRQAAGGQEVIGWQWDGTTLTTRSITASGKGMTVAMAAAGGAVNDQGPHTWLAMRLACMATAVLGENAALASTVEEDVLMLLGHPCIDIRARAVLAVYRCMLASPRVQERGLERIVEIAREARETTMQLASVSVLCELVARRTTQYGGRLVPFLYSLLTSSGQAAERKLVNWIKLKIMRAISLAVQSEPSLANLPDTEETMLEILTLPKNNISMIVEGLLAVATALHSIESLVRLALQRLHELFQDKKWNTDLSVMTLLNSVLLELKELYPGLVNELGMTEIARSAEVDFNTISILREDGLAEAPAVVEEHEDVFEDIEGGQWGHSTTSREGGTLTKGVGVEAEVAEAALEAGEGSAGAAGDGSNAATGKPSRWAMEAPKWDAGG